MSCLLLPTSASRLARRFTPLEYPTVLFHQILPVQSHPFSSRSSFRADNDVNMPELRSALHPGPNAPTIAEYTSWSTASLISRITILEAQLRARNLEYVTPAAPQIPKLPSHPPPRSRSKSPSRRAKPFDPSIRSNRHVALKLAYLGGRYNGFEHSNNNFTPLPTIEEVVWKALRKARLISPKLEEGADESYDVALGEERERRYKRDGLRLDLNWDGCTYSKCGRTDRGVSGFGQVIGVTLRSNKPLERSKGEVNERQASVVSSGDVDVELDNGLPSIDVEDLALPSQFESSFDSIADELPYISVLNSILPPDVRVLAWCPHPPPDFDARFSCRERRYKYFFTNPAFCPTPGPFGMSQANGTFTNIREGWLNIEAMQEAAKKLEGLHDYRNFCKVDPSKQMASFERRITKACIEEASSQAGPVGLVERTDVLGSGDGSAQTNVKSGSDFSGPKVYTFSVHGSAFLWHQVRCMVAILFLVGQGLEKPSLIDDLLDIKKVPCRPTYEMASDAPLVLWDCVFPNEHSHGEDGLDWVYAGDAKSLPALTTKGDGKFGLGGVVDEAWTQWRKTKINEVLTSNLLDLTLQQGDGSGFARGGYRDPATVGFRSQKVFDGRETARLVGEYVPVLEKPRLESAEIQNSKWRARKDAKIQANIVVGSGGTE